MVNFNPNQKHKTMKNQDIVITGLQSWDIEIGSNCKNIAVEFSKNNRVLFVNPPMDRLSLWSRKNRSAVQKYLMAKQNQMENPVQAGPGLWVYYPGTLIESISRIPVERGFDLLNKRNNKLYAKEIKKVMIELGFNRHIHFCDSDMFRSFHLKELLDPELYIYYTRDNLLAVDYWKTHGTRLEPRHMTNADLVVANSTYLARQASEFNLNSHFVGQGCDVRDFNPGKKDQVPPDVMSLSGPVIGYIGSLTTLRLDPGIIEHIARSKPEWNILLVGPEDEGFKQSILHQLPNVYFLGRKAPKELPAYLKAFDIAINPQAINEVTIGNYPRKIDEYLAMGTPVVATRTETMNYFKDHLSLAGSKEEWVAKIHIELKKDSPTLRRSRMDFASSHTWENNVNEIYKQINNTRKSWTLPLQ